MGQKTKDSFFTKDPTFYRTLFPLLITVALQNIVAYSVNMQIISCLEVTAECIIRSGNRKPDLFYGTADHPWNR